MPLITPTGLLCNFDVVFSDLSSDKIWTFNDSGLPGPNNDRTIEYPPVETDQDFEMGLIVWALIAGTQNPSFSRNDGGSGTPQSIDTHYPTYSFYIWISASTTLYEWAVPDAGDFGNFTVRFSETDRPTIWEGAARVLFATSGQTATITNFVQGIGTPAAPAAPTLTAGDMEIAANWAEPDDFGSPITGYDLEYSTDGGGNYTEIDVGDVTTYDITSLTNGVAVLVRVRARNAIGDGDYGPTASETPVVTDLTPIITNVANQSATVGTLFSVTLPVAVSGDPPLTYTVTGRPSWLAFNANSRALSGTPTVAGTSPLTYTVTDVDGDSDSDTFDMVAENPPLVIGDFVIPSGQLLANVAVFTAGRNSTNFIYKSDGATVGTLEDGTLPGNITRIRDRGPNDFQLNDNPSTEDIEAFFTTGAGSDFTIYIQDFDGVASIAASTLNAGASNANNARFNSSNAFDTIVSRISDGDSFILAFTRADLTPAAPTIADQSAVVGTAFSITLAVGTGGNPPLSYSLTGLPPGFTFVSATRVLSGTPASTGTSTLTYTVTDDDGDSDSDSFFLVIAAADLTPTAPTIADQSGVVGTAFSVTLAVGTGGDPPLSYVVTGRPAWLAFNTTTRVLSGTPTAVGTSTLTYTVTDVDGDSDSDDFDLVVTAALPNPPVANFSRAITNLTVVFTDTSTNTPTSWLWDFDDGNTSTSQNPTHTYASAGTYTVELTATNAGGSDDRSKTVTVTAPDLTPTAPTIADQGGIVGTAFSTILAIGTGGNPPLSYAVTGRPAWLAFNTNTRALSGTPTAAGTTTLTYTVTDDDGDSDSSDFDIIVTAGLPNPPVANFSRVITDLNVVFTDTSTNTPTSWSWDFDDGNTSTAQNPSHNYASGGTYTVTLTATNAGGSDDRSKTFTVTAPPIPVPPVASFTSSISNLVVAFTDTSTETPTSWSWSFGDGNTSTQQNPSHTYVAAGTYSVELTASNSDGSDTFSASITVTAALPNAPVANFSRSISDLTVTFTDTSTGNPTSWSWDFGDGNTSTTQNPTHAYLAAGTYTVELTATNAGGSDDRSRSVTVTEALPDAPVASFLSFVNHLEVTFTDTSTGNPTSWAWNFGDNGTSTQQNPVHIYASAGSRTVSLTATNAGGSDTHTATVTAIAPSTPGSPGKPLVSITTTSFTFSWSEPDTGGDPIIDYTFEYRREGVTPWITDTTVNRSYIVSGLSPNTNYEVRIRARNSLGNGVFSTRSTFTTSRLSMLLFDGFSLPDLNINLHANFGETSPVTQPIPGSDGVWAISRGPGRTDKGVVELQAVINVQDPDEMEDERRAIYALQNRGFRRLTYNLRNQSYAVYCEARIESITMDFDDTGQTNLMQPITIQFEVPEPKWYEDIQPVWRFNTGLQFDTSYNGIALRFDNTNGVAQATGSALNLAVASTDFNVNNEYEFTISTKSTTTTLLSTVIRTTIATVDEIPGTNVICSLQRIVDGVAVDSFIYYHNSPRWTANTPLAIQTQYNILQWDGDDLPGRRTDGRYILINHPNIFRLQPGDNHFIFKSNNPNVDWSIIGDYRHAYR